MPDSLRSVLPDGQSNSESFVALVGSPNSGKTTLFNWLTGSRFRTVNYPGATVEYSLGKIQARYHSSFNVMDTPGTASLEPRSPDEVVTRDAIFSHRQLGSARLVISVVDCVQLSRHLLVTQQLIAAGFQVVVVVTMSDLLREMGQEIDTELLAKKLACPVLEVDGRLGSGVQELVSKVESLLSQKINSPLPKLVWQTKNTEEALKRALAIASDCVKTNTRTDKKQLIHARHRTQLLDKYLLHPIMGPIFFFLIMALFFTCVFWVATPFMQAVDWFFSSLGATLVERFPDAIWAQFLSGGVLASISSVLTFVPQIFILFTGVSLLEDSGYLARSASLADYPFSKIGLNGRSFVPLLSGFACAVPAMMAVRTMSSKKERLLTLFILPLMSCSARLPVYALLLGFLYRGSNAWKGGLFLAMLYMLSLCVGALAASLASRFLRADSPSFFMLELPLYRRPRLRTALRTSVARTKNYLRKAGPAIFIFALLIWTATAFPNFRESNPSIRLETSFAGKAGHQLTPLFAPMGADWRIGVGLLSAFAAREVFVSSLAMVFQVTEGKNLSMRETLYANMAQAKAPDGLPLFTFASIFGLVLYFMIALQCLSTVAMAAKESGSAWFALTQLLLFNIAGYALAVSVVQTLRAIGIS